MVALAAGLFGGAPGIAAARVERESSTRALSRALWFSLWALAIPLCIILLNGLRRPACDPLGGFRCISRWPFLPPRLRRRWASPAAFSPRAARAGSTPPSSPPRSPSRSCRLRGPQVFVFHHLGGMYPGPIYDEAIATSRALWLFRAGTLAYAGACAGVALLAGPPRPRRRGVLALAASGAAAVWLSLQAEKLHWKASTASSTRSSGPLETEHLVLHFPREKKDEERALLARDAELDLRGRAASSA